MSRALVLIVLTVTLSALAGCAGQTSLTENTAGNTASAPQRAVAPEKGNADVILKSYNDKKISVIKAVREITGLGLADAKDLVEAAPASVKRSVSRDEAEQIRQKLEEAGATVEIRW